MTHAQDARATTHLSLDYGLRSKPSHSKMQDSTSQPKSGATPSGSRSTLTASLTTLSKGKAPGSSMNELIKVEGVNKQLQRVWSKTDSVSYFDGYTVSR